MIGKLFGLFLEEKKTLTSSPLLTFLIWTETELFIMTEMHVFSVWVWQGTTPHTGHCYLIKLYANACSFWQWIIGNLRNMAIDMGSELDNQNRMIDRINAKVNLFDPCPCISEQIERRLMNLRFSFDTFYTRTQTGRIKRNKDSGGKRASTSASQINLSLSPHTNYPTSTPPHLPNNQPTSKSKTATQTIRRKKKRQKSRRDDHTNIMPDSLRRKNDGEPQYLYKSIYIYALRLMKMIGRGEHRQAVLMYRTRIILFVFFFNKAKQKENAKKVCWLLSLLQTKSALILIFLLPPIQLNVVWMHHFLSSFHIKQTRKWFG